MSTYEPGTVAVATVRGVPNVRVIRRATGWAHDYVKRLGFTPDDELGRVTDIRPLVVLDLADNPIGGHEYARTELLRSLRAEQTLTGSWLADQIEQQTRPPKPAEPTGLGAVVEDARGDFWVYTGLRNAKDGETRLWFHGSLPADYADINAVKVLSEGVQS